MAAEINPNVVVQEMIEGPDTAKVVYLSYYVQGGQRIASCVFRELRTGPINFGCASVVEPILDSEVESVCNRSLRSLGYKGLCEIELKRDSRDGSLGWSKRTRATAVRPMQHRTPASTWAGFITSI
jgi:D-aspartate ligase